MGDCIPKKKKKTVEVGDVGASLSGPMPFKRGDRITQEGLFRDIPNFKCHSAVVYWLLCEIYDNDYDIFECLYNVQNDNGPPNGWIARALGYNSSSDARVQGPDDCNVGDILYMPHSSAPMHSVICIGNDQIKGFNNGGTWGGAGDQWTNESIAQSQWTRIGDKRPFKPDEFGELTIPNPEADIYGLGPGCLPVYKRSHSNALSSLRSFI